MTLKLGLDVGELLVVLAMVAMAAIAAFFIVCRRYEDGFFGNLALLAIIGACALTLKDAWRHELEMPSPTYCLLIAGMAIFFIRHAWRFAMFHWYGRYAWLRPRDRNVDATVPLGWKR